MKTRGFSLLELMIVVAIMAFLAMVAMPSFSRFLAKAKRAEVYAQLSSLYAAQKTYWAEHGTYANTLSGDGSLGWKPEGYHGGGSDENFYYTYGFGSGAEGKHYFTGKLGTASTHLTIAKAETNSFIIVAAGDIDGDGKPDIWAVDQNNKIWNVQDDLAD